MLTHNPNVQLHLSFIIISILSIQIVMTVSRALSITSLKIIGEDLSAQPEQGYSYQLKRQYNQAIQNYLTIPKYLEMFCWLFALNAFTAACEMVVRVPFDLFISCLNTIRGWRGVHRIPHTSLYSCLIMFGFYVTTRDWEIFSVSYLYHSFRGQSSVKLYGAGLALQISQKLLTMGGVWLLGKVYSINRHKTEGWTQLFSTQMVPCMLYVLLHFFSLYLDFILFTIVINSEQKNMLMYFFVVNLGKLKAATFKKFDPKNFRKSVVYDGKDRFLKITHSLLFIMTSWQRIQTQDILQIILVLFYCALIDHFRHFASLAMASRYSQVEVIYRDVVSSFEGLGSKVERFMEWDFTVIPYVLLLLKFFDLAVWSNRESLNFNFWLTGMYICLVIYCYILFPILKYLIGRTIGSSRKLSGQIVRLK